MARHKAKAKRPRFGDDVIGRHDCRWCGRPKQLVYKSYTNPDRLGILFCLCGRVTLVTFRDIGKPVKRRAQRVIDGARELALKAAHGKVKKHKLKARAR